MATDTEIALAASVLRGGGLVAFPTETVYGLGADAQNEHAVRRIFAVKGRPVSHPLIVHLSDAAELSAWTLDVSPLAAKLAEAFWPGALTLVVPRSARAMDVVTGGQGTVALRVPAVPMARDLLREFGGAIAAPSANRFGKVSPTSAEHVRADLGDEVELILDGGPCPIGVESTIVDLTAPSPAILRPGGISKEELEAVLGGDVPVVDRSPVRTPGLLPVHYAPQARLVLAEAQDVARLAEVELGRAHPVAVIAPGSPALPRGAVLFAVPPEPAAYARVLYATLREIDRRRIGVAIAVLPPPVGLGLAVRDRLTRAAG